MLRGLFRSALLAAALGGLAACDGLDDALTGNDNVHGLGGHGDLGDPWAVLEREQREGPPRYTSRIHNCAKIRYATFGRMLASRGVDLTRTDATSAGAIYNGSAQALGAPNYFARIRENLELGVSFAARTFEIYLQAAPEIIANLATSPACGVPMFLADGRCNAAGITCLIGVPATAAHLDICNTMVARATDVATGQALAVAAIASAANTCE
jgi:hypothetical protein